MNSIVPPSPHRPKSLFRKPCAIKRCAELAPFGQMLCDMHEAMAPVELTDAVAEANRAFIAAAQDNDMDGAMRALERGLMTERRIRLSIEAMEAEVRKEGVA